MEWLLWLEDGHQIGLYCSDVSGAFDRVSSHLLRRKLRALRLPACLYRVLSSWLEDRVSRVVVDGQFSAPRSLRDSVFQGTVLCPPLWNVFFGDAERSLTDGFVDTTYADDKNAYKKFGRSVSHELIEKELRECQICLHLWGLATESFSIRPRKASTSLSLIHI